MRFEIVTIFPEFFTSIFENGILRRALAEGLVSVGVHDLRAFTHDRHRTVDDRPFGGGEGMVLKLEPLAEALASLGIQPKAARQKGPQAADSISSEGGGGFNPRIKPQSIGALAPEEKLVIEPVLYQGTTLQLAEKLEIEPVLCQGTTLVVPQMQQQERGALATEGSYSEKSPSRPHVILLSAQGRPFTQAMARELAATERVVLICGRYEGVDERVADLLADEELSIGDYVLSGGELAAAVVLDAAVRLLPGVLGHADSSRYESFGVPDIQPGDPADGKTADGVPRSTHGSGGILDYPHYTRPADFRGAPIPEVLAAGDHLAIRRWRRQAALAKTLRNRPDLLARAPLTPEDRAFLAVLGYPDKN